MKAISKIHLSDLVADSIINFILENNLKPGDCIPTEKEISTLLGIGKTSVREGIAALKAAGLLESRQGGRVYVMEINIESLLRPKSSLPLFQFIEMSGREELDLIVTRGTIEVAAMKEAAKHLTGETTKSLRSSCTQMAQNLSDVNLFIQYDKAFHKEIMLASGNFILPILFELLSDLYTKQFWEFSRRSQAMNRALDFHSKVCAALERGATNEAVEWLERHLADMEARLRGEHMQ